ncbi:MAG: FAD:protein FMN transferase [Patulibacter sp.]
MTSVSTPGPGGERRRTFEQFGCQVQLRITPPDGHRGHAEQRLDRAEAILAEFDARLSSFRPDSELCALNADPAAAVPASPMMLRFAEAVHWAGRRSDGLVDATLLDAVEAAEYHEQWPLGERDASRHRLHDTPATVGGSHAPVEARGDWRLVAARDDAVHRPPGVRLDSGGLGKGLAADLAATALRGATSWMVDCGGDLRVGGTARRPRAIDVLSPEDPSQVVHRLYVTSGGVATSGVRRRWGGGEHATHQLIDPRTGLPARTDLLQVTALAPTALEAEVLAKTAMLRGGANAHAALTHGGVVVHESGVVEIVPPPTVARRDRHNRRHLRLTIPPASASSSVEIWPL